jgi:uncharacterized membrane protein (DUF106 family)
MLAQISPWLIRTLCTTAAALIVLACILWNIRQRRLRELYAMIWLVFGLALLVVGIFPQVVMYISKWSGIYYLTLIMGFFFVCLFIFILQVSVIVSAHSDAVCTLSQRAAIDRERIESLKREVETLRQQLNGNETKEENHG